MQFNYAELTVNGKSAWRLDFFYNDDYCKLGDLHEEEVAKVRSISAIKEIDFLRYFTEKFLYSVGVREVSGRTHPAFSRFLEHKGWKSKQINSHCSDVSKKISLKNNPVPIVIKQAKKTRRPKKKNLLRKPIKKRIK